MPAIYFYPWLDGSNIDIGPFTLERYERRKKPGNQKQISQSQIDSIMSFYRNSPKEYLKSCLLVRPKVKDFGEELNDDEKLLLNSFTEILCFCYLSERKFFSQNVNYCCKEDFQLYSHGWSGDFDKMIVVTSRRRDGYSMNLIDNNYSIYLRPHHTNPSSELSVVPALVSSLMGLACSENDKSKWNSLYESIINFNLANTDNPLITQESEIISLYSSFQSVL